MIKNLIILIFLVFCAYFDLKGRQIPLKLILLFGLVIAGTYLREGNFSGSDFLLRVMPGIFFILLAFITNQAIGYGDGVVILLIGLLPEISTNMIFILTALLFSAAASLYVLVFRKGGRQTRLPFMPFLLASWGVILIWF